MSDTPVCYYCGQGMIKCRYKNLDCWLCTNCTIVMHIKKDGTVQILHS